MSQTTDTPLGAEADPARDVRDAVHQVQAGAAGSLAMVTIEEAAVLLRCTTSAIMAFHRRGELSLTRVGKLNRILVSDLEKFIKGDRNG